MMTGVPYRIRGKWLGKARGTVVIVLDEHRRLRDAVNRKPIYTTMWQGSEIWVVTGLDASFAPDVNWRRKFEEIRP